MVTISHRLVRLAAGRKAQGNVQDSRLVLVIADDLTRLRKASR
jgi:hypothetical protein